ncbi:MAG: DUF1822 family protein [Fusobacterium sp.]|nr:DUF1822 family protein [Fusobacterium sp.]
MEELLTLAEKEIVEESVNAVRTIADSSIKTKAYYNALAANAVETYLREKGLINGEIFNLHASAKMLADFEIADIQLPNLHIDVRAIFDEEEIFIPKKHFYNNILPDIYLVLKLDEDLKNGALLGFVEPSKINKQNQNDDYYFVNKSFLTPVSELRNLILTASEKTQYMITEVTEGSIEKLIMLYMDHDLDNSKLQKLIDYLKNSAVAREKLVEFENFERLSYLALQEFKDLDLEKNDFTQYIKTLVTTDEFAEFGHEDELSVLFNEESAPAAGGLFIDDEAAPVEEVVAEDEPEQEVYEESELLGENEEEPVEETEEETSVVEDFLETDSDVEEVVEEVEETPAEEIEELPVEEEENVVLDEVEEPVEAEEEPVVPVDEFEAFETVDEFEQEEVAVEDEPVVEEHELILNSDELAIEAGDVLNIELPESVEVEHVEEAPELPEEALSGEDLELQIDGLENITEELSVENVELDEVQVEPEELPVVEDSVDVENFVADEPVVEDAVEVDEAPIVEEELAIDEEPVALEEEVSVEDSEPMFDLEGLEFDTEEDTPAEPVAEEIPSVAEEVVTVSDEDVDNAIAMSALDEQVHEEVEEISNDEASENGEFSLDELLAMENDLSASEDEAPKAPAGFKFDEDEDETPEAPVATQAASEEDLALLSAELDDDFTGEDSEEQPEFVDDEDQVEPEAQEEDEGTDFAFAVDTKPASKKLLAPIAGLVAVIGLVGVGAWYFLFNGKSNNNDIGFVDNNNTSIEDISLDVNDVTPAQTGDATVADIQIPAETTPAPAKAEEKKAEEPALPAAPEAKKAEAPKKAEAKAEVPADVKPVPEPLTLQKIKKDFSQPNTYLSVSKIVWDVPEYLTYNDDFSGYLQTLGSTLKLNLSSDLLLVSENTLFDKIRVRVELKDSGKKFSAEIADGSGAKPVDDLVLQSVKNTLNLLKPPVNSLDTADENLYITIYL